jgi:hypothetical protein
MSVDNKMNYVKTLFVKDKETGFYHMEKADTPLPENCEVVETFENFPLYLFDSMNTPKRFEENLRAMTDERRRVNILSINLSEIEESIMKISPRPKNNQGQ